MAENTKIENSPEDFEIKHFLKEYPGIKYIEKDKVFLFRGIELVFNSKPIERSIKTPCKFYRISLVDKKYPDIEFNYSEEDESLFHNFLYQRWERMYEESQLKLLRNGTLSSPPPEKKNFSLK